jgi:hypothetical protein
VRAPGISAVGGVDDGWSGRRASSAGEARSLRPPPSPRSLVGARAPKGPTGAAVAVSLGVIILLLLVAGVQGAGVATPSLTANPARSLAPEPATGVMAANLQPSSVAVPEGGTVDLLLNLTMQPCGTPVALGITFRFGDGFQFAEDVSVTPSSRDGLPCYGLVAMSYVYHQVGSFSVSALVAPPSSPNITSNSVTVNVTAAAPSLTNALLETTAATLGGVVAVVVVTLAIRRYARPPPSLPPSEV